jgi:hypothetical protein
VFDLTSESEEIKEAAIFEPKIEDFGFTELP